MSTTLLSVASTHGVLTAPGTYYGITVAPAADGTVILADLADAGSTPIDFALANAVSGAFAVLTFSAAGNSTFIPAHRVRLTNGLTVAFTSTVDVTVHYD